MIDIHQLTVKYSQQSEAALQNVTFSAKDQTITGIIGPNGAGKSTLFKSILQLINYQGKIEVDGKHPLQQLSDFAYVEQKSKLDLNFPITVKECVSLGAYPNLNLLKPIPKPIWKRVHNALSEVGLIDLQHQQIGQLSGGQLQRVLIARCLVQNAPYLFLDEPFVGIDAVSEEVIMKTLTQLKSSGHHIFIIHHDMNTVEKYFDNLIILNKQLIAYGPTSEVFTKENLFKAFNPNLNNKEVII